MGWTRCRRRSCKCTLSLLAEDETTFSLTPSTPVINLGHWRLQRNQTMRLTEANCGRYGSAVSFPWYALCRPRHPSRTHDTFPVPVNYSAERKLPTCSETVQAEFQRWVDNESSQLTTESWLSLTPILGLRTAFELGRRKRSRKKLDKCNAKYRSGIDGLIQPVITLPY